MRNSPLPLSRTTGIVRGSRDGTLSNVSRHQCGLMPANFTTFAHFLISSARSLPYSVGDSASGVLPRSAIRALILGSALGVGDQLEARCDRNRWMHLHNQNVAADGSDRCDVTEENEREILEEGRVDRAARRDCDERIAIWRGSHDRLHGDIAGARSVVDNELLAESLRQPMADEARVNVVLPAGREADDNAHRPRRISLR